MSTARPLSTQDMIDMQRRRYEAGDGHALLAAVAWCPIDRNPAPQWVQQAFGAAVQRFQSGKVPTLDETFGFARNAKGKHVAAARRRRFLGLQVAYSVYQMHQAGE